MVVFQNKFKRLTASKQSYGRAFIRAYHKHKHIHISMLIYMVLKLSFPCADSPSDGRKRAPGSGQARE
jgi:hypothetical protein